MNNNYILYTHPVVGEITFKDLIQDLNLIISDLSFFQSIIYDMLGDLSYLSNEDISSLLSYIPINKLNWILDLLKSSSEE